MNKLLAAGFLSLAALGLATAPAPAWLLHHECCGMHCHKTCMKVCCYQYNAFSPPCCDLAGGGGFHMGGSGGAPYCTPMAPPPPDMSCGGDGQAWGSGDFAGVGQLPSLGTPTSTIPPGAVIQSAPSGINFTAPSDNKPTAQLVPGAMPPLAAQPASLQNGYGYTPATPMSYYPGYGAGMATGGYPMPSSPSLWTAFTGN